MSYVSKHPSTQISPHLHEIFTIRPYNVPCLDSLDLPSPGDGVSRLYTDIMNQHSSEGRGSIDTSNVRAKFNVQNVEVWIAKQALFDITLTIPERSVLAFIGPSGCGKSTLLRCLNRMNDLIDNVRIEGGVKIGGHNIVQADVDVIELRKRVGMVFQKSNPFPKSIYDNVAYGLRLHGLQSKSRAERRRGTKPATARRCGTR